MYYSFKEWFLIVSLCFTSIWILAIPVVNACWSNNDINFGGNKPYINIYYFIPIISNIQMLLFYCQSFKIYFSSLLILLRIDLFILSFNSFLSFHCS